MRFSGRLGSSTEAGIAPASPRLSIASDTVPVRSTSAVKPSSISLGRRGISSMRTRSRGTRPVSVFCFVIVIPDRTEFGSGVYAATAPERSEQHASRRTLRFRFKLQATMSDQFVGTKPVEERHRIDAGRLEDFLRMHLEGFRGPLQVEQFKGGQSNPTYRTTARGNRN